jgi:hypothetical protein
MSRNRGGCGDEDEERKNMKLIICYKHCMLMAGCFPKE